MVIDYVVRKTDATEGTRTGTILAAWDGTSTTVQFTDSSTRDAGGSTAGLTFRVTADGTDAVSRVYNNQWYVYCYYIC